MSDFMNSELYYPDPMQVRYFDWIDNCFRGGIVYKDMLIMYDGGTATINEVIEMAAQKNLTPDDAIIELEWLNLNDEILGLL